MSIQKALEKLSYNNDGAFPRGALIEIIDNRDEAIPLLLGVIEYSIENFDRLVMEDAYFAHIYAMYLLAQFREKKAYPLLIRLFSIPGDSVLDFTGDVVTEDLGKIFYSVCHGDIEPLKSLVENSNANEFVRAAGLKCLLIMVATGQKSRSEIIDYYKELFNTKLERHASHVWDALASYSCRLYPEEVFSEIKRAFDEGLVDPFFMGFESIQEAIGKGKDEILYDLEKRNSYKYRSIDDTISELRGWACFNQPENKKDRNSSKKNASVRNDNKTGRNDLCPCGSGKKYKKCCLGKA